MARSKSNNRNNWSEDRKSYRSMKGQETKRARKNERRVIERQLQGPAPEMFQEAYSY